MTTHRLAAPLTVVEAARAIKVSKDAVYDLCDSDKLRHHGIMPGDIDDFRRSSTSTPADDSALRHYRKRFRR